MGEVVYNWAKTGRQKRSHEKEGDPLGHFKPSVPRGDDKNSPWVH